MSTTLEEPAVETAASAGMHRSLIEHEFSYRPVPAIAVVGAILAVVSALGVFVWMAMPLCLVAFIVSLFAYWTIKLDTQAYSGAGVALSGIFLSLAFMASGIAMQVYMYQTEVPEGYERISFKNDISDPGVVVEEGRIGPPPTVEQLDGKKIFFKGYIYQTGRLIGLKSFLMVKDNGDCCFGGKPAIFDRIGVTMSDGKAIDYRAGKVAIAGTFRINPDFTNSDVTEPLYVVQADVFTNKISDF